MLSRRSVRIKVMQTLYALISDKDLTYSEAKKSYWKSIEYSYELLLFNLYAIVAISKYAVKDGKTRKEKHLPTALDKIFTPKLYENGIVSGIDQNKLIQQQFKKLKFPENVDQDLFSKLYKEFTKNEKYHSYLEDSEGSHLEILLELYRFCRSNEIFNEIMQDNYICWTDDKSLIIGALKKCLKGLPTDNDAFFQDYYPDDETVKDYGEVLLKRTFDDDGPLLEMIKPLLKNWDHERLAVIDMILLKMAIVELLEFKTIPTKVTLNEYVEVSKLYSTPKSKDFINGILDKVLRDLSEEGKIVKEGRGLIE